MSAINVYKVVKNLHPLRNVTTTGNLSALLIAIFGTDSVTNLSRCNISVSATGRVQALLNKDIYVVEQVK